MAKESASERSTIAMAAPDPAAVETYISQVLSLSVSNIDAQYLPDSALVQQESVFTTESSKTAWYRHLNKITIQERIKFLSFARGSVHDFARYVEEASENHKKSSRTRKVNELVRPFFRTLGMYISTAAAASQADPSPSSLVVGGVMCLIQISANFTEFQELLGKWLAKMSSKVSLLMQYDLCIYHFDTSVQDALVEVYADLLEFCQKALALFENAQRAKRSGLHMLGKSLKKRFQDAFGDIIDRLEGHLNDYEEKAKLCDKKKVLASYSLQVQRAISQEQFQNDSRDHWTETRQSALELRKLQTQEAISQQEFREESRHVWIQNRRALQDQYAYLADSRHVMSKILGNVGEAANFTHDEAYRRQAEDQRMKAEQEVQRKRQKRKEVLDWIPAVPFNDEHERRTRLRHEGTGLWLENHETFKDWISRAGSDVLWVTGTAGCGKSILSAFVWDRIRLECSENVAFGHFYCRRDDATRNQSSAIWPSLLKELCIATEELDGGLEELFDTTAAIETKGPSSRQIITRLPNLTQSFKRSLILIDGLDECEDPDTFLKDLADLMNDEPHNLKVIIFSRPDWTGSSLKDRSGTTVDMIKVDSENAADIQIYINSKFLEPQYDFRDNARTLETVQSVMLEKAESSFLYVSLQAKSLEGPLDPDPEYLQELLNALPSGLDDAYEQLLQRIVMNENSYHRELALSTIIWVANSIRPLSTDELLEGLAVKSSMTSREQVRPRRFDDHFIRICKNLIDVDEAGLCRLVHSSLKDYLTMLDKACPANLENVREKQRKCHDIIGSACITYLSFEEFNHGPVDSNEDLKDFLERNSFFLYAATNWGHHVRQASRLVSEQPIWLLLDREQFRNLSMQCRWEDFSEFKTFEHPENTTILHLIALFDLVNLAMLREDLQKDKGTVDGFGNIPLDYALLEKNLSICTWLIQTQYETNDGAICLGKYSEFHLAIKYGWNELVELLLHCGYDADSRDIADRTPLMKAALVGNLEAVKKLVVAGVSVNFQDEDGNTALAHAANRSHTDILKFIAEANASLDIADEIGMTALHYAAARRNAKSVQVLVERGATVDIRAGSSLMNYTAMHLAAEEDAPDIINILYSHGAKLDIVDARGIPPLRTAAYAGSLGAAKALKRLETEAGASTTSDIALLHIACRWTRTEFVQFLLEENSGLLQERLSQSLGAPLYWAAMAGNTGLCELLLNEKAEVDEPGPDIYFNESALFATLRSRNLDTTRLLLKHGANPNFKDSQDSTPLHIAALQGVTGAIGLLIDSGAMSNSEDALGRTVQYLAASKTHDDFLRELLIRASDIDLDVRDDDKATLLHVAALAGSVENTQLLLSNGLVCSAMDLNKYPLHCAVESGHAEIIPLLLPYSDINQKDSNGYTALNLAAAWGHLSVGKLLLQRNADTEIVDGNRDTAVFCAMRYGNFNIARLLVNARCDISATNSLASSVLQVAAVKGDTPLLSAILERDCDLYATNNSGTSACMSSVIAGNVGAVQLLASKDIGVISQVTELGTTCLHIAAACNQCETMDALIDLGSDVNAVDGMGRSALMYATSYGSDDAIQLLLARGAVVDCIATDRAFTALAAAVLYTESLVKISLLLKAGADVNLVSERDGSTALTLAAAVGRGKVITRLLAAGADPFHRDGYGRTPIDYAMQLRNPSDILSLFAESVTVAPLRAPIDSLLTVAHCVDGILALGETGTPLAQEKRRQRLEILGRVLRCCEDDLSKPDAKVVHIELLFSSSSLRAPHALVLDCDICHQEIGSSGGHICSTCFDVCICPDCYNDCSRTENIVEHAPRYLQILEAYEEELLPLRYQLLPILRLGAEHLVSTITAFDIVSNVMRWAYETYKCWDAEYGNKFSCRPRPGWELLKMIHEWVRMPIKEAKGVQPFTRFQGDSLPSFGRAIRAHLKEHDDTGSCRPFKCFSHQYLDCSEEEYNRLKMDKGVFDENGALRDEWLSNLKARYVGRTWETTPVSGAQAAVRRIIRGNSMPDHRNREDGRKADDQDGISMKPLDITRVRLAEETTQQPQPARFRGLFIPIAETMDLLTSERDRLRARACHLNRTRRATATPPARNMSLTRKIFPEAFEVLFQRLLVARNTSNSTNFRDANLQTDLEPREISASLDVSERSSEHSTEDSIETRSDIENISSKSENDIDIPQVVAEDGHGLESACALEIADILEPGNRREMIEEIIAMNSWALYHLVPIWLDPID